MRHAFAYVADFDPARERLEALLERVQRDAYAEGSRAAATTMVHIAEQTEARLRKAIDLPRTMVPK